MIFLPLKLTDHIVFGKLLSNSYGVELSGVFCDLFCPLSLNVDDIFEYYDRAKISYYLNFLKKKIEYEQSKIEIFKGLYNFSKL